MAEFSRVDFRTLSSIPNPRRASFRNPKESIILPILLQPFTLSKLSPGRTGRIIGRELRKEIRNERKRCQYGGCD
jgi:hypothetical protein